jgi:hypothetical protein
MGYPASASRATRVAQLLGLAPAAPPPGRIPAMLAARRRIIDQPMVPSALDESRMVPDALVARAEDITPLVSGSVNKADWLRRAAINAVADIGAKPITAGEFLGSFTGVPMDKAGFLGVASYPRGAGTDLSRNIRRHEVMHGYNEAARQGAEGLPFWSRVVAATPQAISRPLDELVAQRAGGASFSEIPWGTYASQYANEGQRGQAAVARGLQAAQVAGRYAPYLAGGAVGTGMLAYGLSQDDEEEQDRQALLAYLRSVTPE